MGRMNLRNKLFSRDEYFPEPFPPTESFPIYVADIEILKSSANEYAIVGRKRLNEWIKDWNFEDKKEVLSRLESPSASHHDGAVWELYLNSLFKHLGFHVVRDPLAVNGKTPDFRITRYSRTYYVEATSISREPVSSPKKHWVKLINQVDKVRRDDFFISFHPSRTSSRAPIPSQIINQINSFLDSLDYDALCHIDYQYMPKVVISDNDWEIRVSPIPKKPKGASERFIGVCGSAGTGMVADLQDLRRKIVKKRKKYGPLDKPFLIAILENSFIGSSDRWHRFGALFGEEALHFLQSGETETVRLDNGIWSVRKKETSVEGLLLLDRLALTSPNLGSPEIWINPNFLNSELNIDIPFTFLRLHGDSYELNASELTWDGLTRPSLSSVMSRILTRIFFS